MGKSGDGGVVDVDLDHGIARIVHFPVTPQRQQLAFLVNVIGEHTVYFLLQRFAIAGIDRGGNDGMVLMKNREGPWTAEDTILFGEDENIYDYAVPFGSKESRVIVTGARKFDPNL